MPHCFLNQLFFLRRTLRLPYIFRLSCIVIFSFDNSILLLYLCNIQRRHFHIIFFLNIILNFLISHFCFRSSQIQLIHIHGNIDICIGSFSNQLDNRLHMCRYYYRNTFYQPRCCHVNTIRQSYVVLLHFFFVV